MKEEAARNKQESRTTSEGKAALKAERQADRAAKAEAARAAREQRRESVGPRKAKKHHPSTSHTAGESRLEMERRGAVESKARYEAGFRAGFAAGLAARRGEAMSACTAPPAARPESQPVASRSTEPEAAPAPAAAPSFSDATVRTTAPIAGGGEHAAYSARPVPEPTAPAAGRVHARHEDASLEATSASHVVPVSYSASLLMLHQPAVAPLRGTLASLERQNQRLDAEGLQRIEDESDLESRIAHKLLVPLPVSGGLLINPRLPEGRRYCRPWTAEFLTDLARVHNAVFHRPLQVDSAVRTVQYQRRLIEINANAAPAEGDVASPHETGAAVDIAKRGMSWREIGWMRRYLMTLQNAGLIDVEEEFYQSCFHITVYDVYGHRSPVRTAGSGSGGGGGHTTEAAADGTQGQ